MRQVGSLPDQRDAERFAAYLVTQGIEAHAEQDSRDWAVWVRDEDQLDQAARRWASSAWILTTAGIAVSSAMRKSFGARNTSAGLRRRRT